MISAPLLGSTATVEDSSIVSNNTSVLSINTRMCVGQHQWPADAQLLSESCRLRGIGLPTEGLLLVVGVIEQQPFCPQEHIKELLLGLPLPVTSTDAIAQVVCYRWQLSSSRSCSIITYPLALPPKWIRTTGSVSAAKLRSGGLVQRADSSLKACGCPRHGSVGCRW
jgi:hypothetical protein